MFATGRMKTLKSYRKCVWSFMVLSILIAAGLGPAAETVDEVLAVVDRNPILRSDLVLAGLVGIAPSPGSSNTTSGHDPLGSRIQLELQFLDLTASGALQRMEIDVGLQLESMTARAGGEAPLRASLATHGLEWEDVEALALRLAAVQTWVSRHLSPRVTVTTGDVEQTYRRVIVEPMREAGTTPPSMALVNEDLRQLVSEEKLNAEIERWLDQCRERHRVTRFVE